MPDLTPQEPGAIGGVDHGIIDGLAEGTVADIAGAVDALTDDELEQLLAAEQRGKARSGAILAIQREQAQRTIGEAVPDTGAKAQGPAPIGDPSSYASLHARDVDPARIDRPVLTLDGWVLPLPRATGEG